MAQFGLYFFCTRSQVVTALVSASEAETRALSNIDVLYMDKNLNAIKFHDDTCKVQ